MQAAHCHAICETSLNIRMLSVLRKEGYKDVKC